METSEITLGPVTYAVGRVYAGDRTASDLILEQLSAAAPADSSFDEGHTKAV